jgi:uncharacterized OB-fold protein
MDEQQALLPDQRVSAGHRLILTASRDKKTGLCVFPEVPVKSPSATRFEPIELLGVATLYSYTIIHPNPKTGLPPFALIYADFPEGARIFGRLHLPEGQQPKIGMKLTVEVGTESPYIFAPTKGAQQ